MTDVFISYSRKDKAFVRRLFDELEQHGLDAWVDWEDIPPSVDWMSEILEGIENANYFVFVITPDSVHSKVAYAELEHAVSHNKILLPLLHRDVKLRRRGGSSEIALDETLSPLDRAYSALGFETDADRVMARLSPHNWIMFREEDDFEASLAILLEAMATDTDYVREHTRLLVRAREWEGKGRDPSFLLTEIAIDEAEAWLKRGETVEPKPTDLHQAYINASRLHQLKAEQQKMALEKRAADRLRYLAVVLALFSVAAVILSVFAFRERSAADHARATSDANLEFAIETGATAERRAVEAESFVLSERARLALENQNFLLSLALSMEAVNVERPIPAAQTIFSQVAYIAPRRRLEPPSSWVMQMVTVPDSDLMISANVDRTLILWDWRVGEALRTYEGHNGIVSSVALSPDGTRILSGSWDGTAILWDIQSGEMLHVFDGHSGSVTQVQFTEDGQQAVTTSCRAAEAQTIGCLFEMHLWDVESGSEIDNFIYEDGVVDEVAISPNGRYIAIGLTDPPDTVEIWEVGTWEALLSYDLFDSAVGLAFSADSSLLAVGDAGNALALVDIESLQELDVIYTYGSSMSTIAFNPLNAQVVAAGHENGNAGEANFTIYSEDVRFSGQDEAITDIAYTSDAQHILMSSQDGTMLVWDRQSGAIISRFIPDNLDIPRGIWVLPDEQKALAVFESGSVLNVNFEDNSTEFLGFLDVDLVDRAVFSPDGTRVLVWSEPSRLSVWDVESGEEMFVLLENQSATLATATFSPDSQYLLTYLTGEQISLRDATTGEVLRNFADIGVRPISLAFSPAGDIVLAGTNASTIYVLDFESGDVTSSFNTIRQTPQKLAFSVDGKSVFTVDTRESFVLQWDVASGTLMQRFEGHTDDVTDLVVLPGGEQFMTSSADTNVIVWNIAQGAPVRRLQGHLDVIDGVEASDNGDFAVSYTGSNGLIMWRLQSLDELIEWTCENRAVRDLTDEERASYGITSTGENLCDRYLVVESAPDDATPEGDAEDANSENAG